MGEGKHTGCEHPTRSVEASWKVLFAVPGSRPAAGYPARLPPVFPALGYTVLFTSVPKYIVEAYSQTMLPKPILQLKLWVYSSRSDPGEM